MSNFKKIDFDFSEMSLEEGFKLFLKGPIASIGYGYSLRGDVVAGKHWTATWVNTQGMGNYGTCLIKPNSKESRALVRDHVVDSWKKLGLTEAQARALYRLDVRYKHELVSRVAACVADAGVVEAFATFPGVGPDSHNPWYKRWENLVQTPLHGISWWRRAALIEMVNSIA